MALKTKEQALIPIAIVLLIVKSTYSWL